MHSTGTRPTATDSLRVATVSQHQTERLRHHLDKTAVQFVVEELSAGGEPIKPQANPQGLLRPKEHLGALIDRRTARHIYYTNTVHNVRIASTCRWRS